MFQNSKLNTFSQWITADLEWWHTWTREEIIVKKASTSTHHPSIDFSRSHPLFVFHVNLLLWFSFPGCLEKPHCLTYHPKRQKALPVFCIGGILLKQMKTNATFKVYKPGIKWEPKMLETNLVLRQSSFQMSTLC